LISVQLGTLISDFRALNQEGHMKPKFALIGLLALGAVGLVPRSASALPNGLTHTDQISSVEQVRRVCNPWGRCWWRPNYYRSFGYYPAPLFVHPYWGWRHRGWHRW
jgi:hypothetical protein